MLTYIVLAVIWGLVSFFATAELYVRFKVLQAFLLATMLNVVLFVVVTAIWFAAESDGFAQLFGAIFYSIVLGVFILATALVFIVLERKKRRR